MMDVPKVDKDYQRLSLNFNGLYVPQENTHGNQKRYQLSKYDQNPQYIENQHAQQFWIHSSTLTSFMQYVDIDAMEF